MLGKTILLAAIGMAALATQPAQARDDTVIGALIGAGVGAAIGHSAGGERGAVLGGAIGAVTGATIGGADRGYVRTHYEPAPAYYAPPSPVYVERPYIERRAPVVVERIAYPPPHRYREWREHGGHHHWHRRHDRRCDHGNRHDDGRDYREYRDHRGRWD